MYKSGFDLILDLLKEYLCEKLHISRAAIQEKLSTESHAQWTVNELDIPATITGTGLSDDNTILNFISGLSVRTVQVSMRAIGVEQVVKIDKITPTLKESFSKYVDSKLLKQGGFWKQPPAKQDMSTAPSIRDRDRQDVPNIAAAGPRTGPPNPSRPPDMPDFEDEYELKAHRNNPPQAGVFGIGERDLNPPGLSRDPLMKPFIDPLAGDVAGGGMYPTADHPMFGQRGGKTSRLGVPPGARYDDPYGEDNLEDMGMGLPGNLRRPGSGNGPGAPGGAPFGGSQYGGPPFGGHLFGGGML